MFKVFQIQISEQVIDFVNGPDGGHTRTAQQFPEYHARLETSHAGSERFEGDWFAHYNNVCTVARDGGLVDSDGEAWLVRDLEDVFAVLNGRYYDEDSNVDLVHDSHVSGFTMKTAVNSRGEPYSVRNMHSLSVGDIVFDSESDTYNMVDGAGFSDITAQILSSQPGV